MIRNFLAQHPIYASIFLGEKQIMLLDLIRKILPPIDTILDHPPQPGTTQANPDQFSGSNPDPWQTIQQGQSAKPETFAVSTRPLTTWSEVKFKVMRRWHVYRNNFSGLSQLALEGDPHSFDFIFEQATYEKKAFEALVTLLQKQPSRIQGLNLSNPVLKVRLMNAGITLEQNSPIRKAKPPTAPANKWASLGASVITNKAELRAFQKEVQADQAQKRRELENEFGADEAFIQVQETRYKPKYVVTFDNNNHRYQLITIPAKQTSKVQHRELIGNLGLIAAGFLEFANEDDLSIAIDGRSFGFPTNEASLQQAKSILENLLGVSVTLAQDLRSVEY